MDNKITEEEEIKEMIDNFRFEEFLNPPKDSKKALGAWLIITDEQCVMGYNDHNGEGYHSDSIRKAFCKVLDEEKYSPFVTPSYTQSQYIIGTMMSAPQKSYILFRIDRLEEISSNQLKLLEKFQEKYNDLIEKRSLELHESVVLFEHKGMEIPGYNLDTFYNYLSKRKKINDNKVFLPDRNKIGQITLEKEKRKEKKF